MQLLMSIKSCASIGLRTRGGEKGPVTLPAFKAGDPALRGSGGGFDSHTLPPQTTASVASTALEAHLAPSDETFSVMSYV